jgi:DNA-binding LacI/PurR family transcriptional regulator
MPTLADVAKRAGVSLSTASYVMSGKRPISDDTRQRVLAAMDELGFQPNNQGRALASGKSRAVALLYPLKTSVATTMPLDFVISAAAAAEARGYLLVLSTNDNTDDHLLSMIERGFVDGYILMEIALHDSRVDLLKQRRLPFTMIGHCAENDGLDYVDVDFDFAVESALDYLTKLGHRNFAMVNRIATDPVYGYGPAVRSRLAFEAGIARRGLFGLAIPCEATPEAGVTALNLILDEFPQITAVIAMNGEAASGLLHCASDRGVSIPNDLSVFGVLSPRTAELLVPQLTSVDFPAEEMGRSGVEFLIDALEGGDHQPQQLLFQPSITVRASTGFARDLIAGT